MRISIREDHGVTILDLNGRLVSGDGDAILRDALEKLIDEGKNSILVNFGSVTSMDSSGIGELVSGWKHARERGSSVAILRPGDRVRYTLHLSQILPLLDVYENEETAVQAMGQG
ncbi:MAG: STAS domain-containing protein [Acidobacteria bacterium]|jgi:anti-sigma B factor antagonist|nr:STAS domain-containing protein [Acidobacteriota bacterium]